MAVETPIETLVSTIGKGGDAAVAEPPKETAPETTPVDKGNAPTVPQEPKPEPPKEPETPKPEEPKAGEPTTPVEPETPKDGEPETKPETEPGAKPEDKPTEPDKPIDWDSKEYLKGKQSKNGEEDTFIYKEFRKDMGKALNLQPNSDRDTILREVESLREKAYTSDNIFANENLRQANEIAKNKGDWRGYLDIASINIDSKSDEELIRLKMQENKHPEEFINEYLEEHKDTAVFKKEAAEIRQSLIYTREQRTKELADNAQKAEDQRDVQTRETNERLKKVINEATSINGFKFDDEAKSRILDIATGTVTIGGVKYSKLLAHLLYDNEGNIDPQKVFNTITKSELFDGITNFLKGEGKTAGKRETMDNLQNVDLGITPVTPKEEKKEEETGLAALNRKALEEGQKPLHVIHSQ